MGAVQREANQLVEEFMLLANMSVARMVAAAFPDRAMLRRHPPPNERKIQDLSHLAEELVRINILLHPLYVIYPLHTIYPLYM